MQLLGPNLKQLMERRGCLSEPTVAVLAIQMITVVERVHDMSIVMRDVKPDNFCIGAHQAGRGARV